MKLAITRIFSHWSTDDTQLENFVRGVVRYHFANTKSISSNVSDASYKDSNPDDAGVVRTESISGSQLLPLVLDEICRRADMIGVIRYLSDAVTQSAKAAITPGAHIDVSAICIQIVEPICHRFDAIASASRIPGVLQSVVRALMDTKPQHRSDALLLLAESLVPKVVQWVTCSTAVFRRRFDVQDLDDSADNLSIGEQSVLLETIQELLKLCFCRLPNTSDPPGDGECGSIRSKTAVTLSLANHAVLSRSKWLIAR